MNLGGTFRGAAARYESEARAKVGAGLRVSIRNGTPHAPKRALSARSTRRGNGRTIRLFNGSIFWPWGELPEGVEFTYREYCLRTYDGVAYNVVRGLAPPENESHTS